MRSRTRTVLLAVGLLAITFGVIDSQAGPHRHRLTVRHYVESVTLPPATDPRTSGVRGAAVGCPRGYRATGGGYASDTIAVVPFAQVSPGEYGAIGINQTDQAGRLEVVVACIRGMTRLRNATSGGVQMRRLVEGYRAQR